ncbi:hypothetical protein QFZ82_004653 [Streptomyces sp. V4I23]|uniref:hypothetical protein n=1 Tax=Streptomyces sp. V4I23 TaxID=3042282 RepID=UPI002785A233|nr:hypothetical protein [Streptomyces sp. V4I23]MDQ1010168.1 hypothetical protein [Streptomyces sp. V4I23]
MTDWRAQGRYGRGNGGLEERPERPAEVDGTAHLFRALGKQIQWRRSDVEGFSGYSLEDLERRVHGRGAVGGAENWERIRELSVGRMQSAAYPREIRIRWAHLALAAIAGKYAPPLEDPMKSVTESAHVRSFMIQAFGESEEDEARRIGELCAHVETHLGMTREEALQLASEWRGAPREQVLHLRRIKNMLTPLAAIHDLLHEEDPIQEDITEWLSLIPRLP